MQHALRNAVRRANIGHTHKKFSVGVQKALKISIEYALLDTLVEAYVTCMSLKHPYSGDESVIDSIETAKALK